MVALLALLLVTRAAAFYDSEGTHFNWNFIRNADPNVNLPNQKLSVTILNGANAGSCDFTMSYRPDFTSPFKSSTVTVPANATASLDVPSFYGFAYCTTGSPQNSGVPSITLSAKSTCPVTLLANNYDSVTGQGDTFLVLPTSWGSLYYTFTLPPAQPSAGQYQVVTFIPTQGTATVTLDVVEHNPHQTPVTFPVDGTGSLTSYIATTTYDGKPRTYRIVADKPIQIVAGVTCVGVYGGSCDHVAFMPHPVPSFDCRAYDWVDDDHISDTVSTGSFYVDIPTNCPIVQDVMAYSAGAVGQQQFQLLQLRTNNISTLQTFSPDTFCLAVAFHAGGSATHITRFYDSSSAGGQGAFLTSVAAPSSYITDNSYFYTRNANDTIEIICTILYCVRTYVDGLPLNQRDTAYDVIRVDGVTTYYSFTFPLNQSGLHTIVISGGTLAGQSYTYYVSGRSGSYGYGYMGQVNKPTLNMLPPRQSAPHNFPVRTV